MLLIGSECVEWDGIEPSISGNGVDTHCLGIKNGGSYVLVDLDHRTYSKYHK